MKSSAKLSILTAAASVSLALLLFFSAITAVVVCKPLYPLFRGELANPYKLSEQEMDENYSRLIAYSLSFGSATLDLIRLPMSPEGRQHFVEVRRIFHAVIVLLLLTSALTLLFSRILKRIGSRLYLRSGAFLAMGLPALLALPLLIDFNSSFTLFHKLLFSNDYWIFDPRKDPVILYLPQSFFMKMGLSILALLLLFALLCLLRYKFAKPGKSELKT